MGIIGADLGVEKVLGVTAPLPAVEPVPLAYDLEDEVVELLRPVVRTLDVALFCGPVPFQLARGVLPPALPATYVPYDGSGLVKALFDFHRLPAEGPEAFSIDSLPRAVALQVVAEVELAVAEIVTISDGEVFPRDELVAAHEALWRAGRIRAALTYLRSVHRDLDARGIPTVYVQPLTTAIRIAVERALLLTESRSHEAAQLAVVLVQLPVPGDDGTRVQKLELTARSLLLDVSEETDAALLPMGPGLYALYTTKAGLDRIPDWPLGGLPFLDRIADVLGVEPKVGIGFGGTSRDAQANARRALALAADHAGPSAYAVLRDGRLLGPLGAREATARETRVHDTGVLEDARRAGVAARSLALVYGYLASFSVFDTEKLARLLGVSDRSARRIVNRLLAAGIVESAGEEAVHRRGRPRGLYRLAAPAVEAPPDGKEHP